MLHRLRFNNCSLQIPILMIGATGKKNCNESQISSPKNNRFSSLPLGIEVRVDEKPFACSDQIPVVHCRGSMYKGNMFPQY